MKDLKNLSKLFYDLFIKNMTFLDFIIGPFALFAFIVLFIMVKLDDLYRWVFKKEKRNGRG